MDNLYDWSENIERKQRFPNSFRCLIIGESNSGKTCLLLKFILEPLWLDYNNLILIGNSLDQLKYRIITEAFTCGYTKEEIRQLFSIKNYIMQSKVGKILCSDDENEGMIRFLKSWKEKNSKSPIEVNVSTFDSNDDIPDPRDIDKNKKSIVIFDDTMNNKNQDIQKSYFTRGRHSNCSIFYLAQSYFALDRKSIRMNSNVLILFRLDERDIQNIWYDKISKDLTLEHFRTFCRHAWNEDYGFVFINFNNAFKTGKRYKTHRDLIVS